MAAEFQFTRFLINLHPNPGSLRVLSFQKFLSDGIFEILLQRPPQRASPKCRVVSFLGEKLFLTWIRDGMTEGRLGPDDVMGLTLPQLNAWLA